RPTHLCLPYTTLFRSNEEFGKLTFTPTGALLFNGSYRTSKRTSKSSLFAANAASTTGTGDESKQNIGILEGSWILGSKSFATVKDRKSTRLNSSHQIS